MKFIFKVAFVFTLLLVSSLWANIDECKNDLYYANGIMMNETEQNATLIWKDKVDDLLLTKPETFNKLSNILVAYNKSEWFDDDIYESFEQLMSNEWGWEQFSVYYRVYLQTLGMQELGNQHANDLTKQVTSYKQSIKLGHSVIVIAHSQGNYFTNEAYELLDEWMKPYFKMMGVATPANHVAGFEAGDTTAPYVKFHNDFIKIVVTGLSSNRDDPNPNHNRTISVAAHDFYDSYLTAENTKGEILGFIEEKIEEHTTASSQWETNEEYDLNTCDYRITVKHRYDPSIEMDDIDTMVYPFAPAKKLYQVNEEWVKASCGGENIMGIGHDIVEWDGKKENECWMIDNSQEEKIVIPKKIYYWSHDGSVYSTARGEQKFYDEESAYSYSGLHYYKTESFHYFSQDNSYTGTEKCEPLPYIMSANFNAALQSLQEGIESYKEELENDSNIIEIIKFEVKEVDSYSHTNCPRVFSTKYIDYKVDIVVTAKKRSLINYSPYIREW